ncbi:helix-turn-helix transcriptional regulator [Herbaspirillum sp. LeCh32-8]|uniref:helix-turn-helix domain-containing protein n=1 Tax=Herbaspirillum sp. LeCh32-8 TaxID=2821356 RepID=UPI001AE7CDD7|nr:helix-turn-helix transcriptional regulator [Herbaspirillum sp. LeCh32-8]MBP0598882.1 helix-turn-helix transcriptional regulator [Herbaspirillum sp. LeCh32-8]
MKKKTPPPPTSTLELVGLNIRRERLKLGWTQLQLANHLDIEMETISRYERGLLSPSFEKLDRMVKLFEIAPWCLFLSPGEQKYLSASSKTAALSDDQLAALATIVDAFVASHSNEK